MNDVENSLTPRENVPATMLLPYLKCEPVADQTVSDAYFSEFSESHRHPSLPFVMRRDYYESGESGGAFRHMDFLALYAVKSGRAVHWIDDHPYGLVRGDVYLMAPGSAHRFTNFTELEIDGFFFQTSLFNSEELAALRECPGIWRLFAGGIEMEHRIHLRPEEWRTVETHIEVMRSEWVQSSRVAELRLKHEFFHLLASLARLLEKSSPLPASHDEERQADTGLAEALRFCEEHFDKPLSVPKLAARAFLSPGHFSERFTREVGMPPASYVRRIRLEKARSLLRDSKMPVAEIASHCGFSNAEQFSRAFRNFYESSPREYRNKEQQA